MSKYNDFMSHIRVDDDMHRRVMDAVSKAIKEESGASAARVEPLSSNNASVRSEEKAPAPRRAKVSLIKGLSIAAASVIVVGGALFLAARFFSGSAQTKNIAVAEQADAAETTAAAINRQVDSALGVAGANSNKSQAGGIASRANEDEKEEAVPEGIDPSAVDYGKKSGAATGNRFAIASMKARRSDFINALPFKIKNLKTGKLEDGKISTLIFEGEKDEQMILFTAEAGADIVKAYYPGFKGVPVLFTTKNGQQFYAVDVSAEEGKQVSPAGPFDAVTWTKDGSTYMLAFNSKTDKDLFTVLIDKF